MSRQHDLPESRIVASYRKAYAVSLSEDETQMLDAAEHTALTALIEELVQADARYAACRAGRALLDSTVLR